MVYSILTKFFIFIKILLKKRILKIISNQENYQNFYIDDENDHENDPEIDPEPSNQNNDILSQNNIFQTLNRIEPKPKMTENENDEEDINDQESLRSYNSKAIREEVFS